MLPLQIQVPASNLRPCRLFWVRVVVPGASDHAAAPQWSPDQGSTTVIRRRRSFAATPHRGKDPTAHLSAGASMGSFFDLVKPLTI
ncbi:hypothetical protein E4U55_003210 [Claviceps digitariae]|nr:hypothetical protein E4U55_003210 [Claviceps digitariae]